MSTRAFSPRSLSRGYVSLLALLLVALLAVFAGIQLLLLLASVKATGAFDCRRDQELLESQLKSLSLETTLHGLEGGLVPPKDLASTHASAFSQLKSLSGRVRVSSLPPSFPAWGAGYQGWDSVSYGACSSLVSNLASPSLRPLLQGPVCEGPSLDFVYSVSGLGVNSDMRESCLVRVHPLAVPLTRYPISCYELSSEVADASALPLNPAAPLGLLGLAPGRDPAASGSWRATPGVLPYHFRLRASSARAYESLFSQDLLQDLAMACGSTRRVHLGKGRIEGGLPGMKSSGDTLEWDLSEAGLDLGGDCLVTNADDGALQLSLHTSSSAEALPPLRLWLVAPAHNPLLLRLGSCTRPVLLLCLNSVVQVAPGSDLNLALILSMNSSLKGGPARLSHLSFYAGSEVVDCSQLSMDKPVDARLERIAPRLVGAVAEVYRQ